MPFNGTCLRFQMKTVYYETTASSEKCNFDITVEVSGPDTTTGQCSTSWTTRSRAVTYLSNCLLLLLRRQDDLSSPGRLCKVRKQESVSPSHRNKPCKSGESVRLVGEATRQMGFSWCRPLCRRYRPPPNELQTESSLTVMKIQLPTGVEAYPEDLRQVSLAR